MAKTREVAELQAQVAALMQQVDLLMGRAPRTEDDLAPEDRPDYIAYGSPEHVAFLGLKEVAEDEKVTPKAVGLDGKHYTLIDKTIFGTAVRPFFLQAYLEQRVGQLKEPEVPAHAPPMWRPTEVLATGDTV